MVSVAQAVYRLRRVPPRRLPVLVGRYALRTARARARRWHIQRHRGELSNADLERSLRGITPAEAFDRFLRRFFVTPTTARAIAARIATSDPDRAARTRHKAQEALDHIFDLLGSGPVPLGQEIDWHRDFKTGRAWPSRVLADD